jgi:uncharacterized protein (UPF0548 family)
MESSVRLRKPSAKDLDRFLDDQRSRPFSYEEVGATRTTPPRNRTVDHNRVELGRGAVTWDRARAAIRGWAMFRFPWIAIHPSVPPVREGACVVVLTHQFGLWWLNASRIVYAVEETGPVHRYGFAYGTLPGHAESGEERFTVELHESDQSVWYDLLAFSRPHFRVVRWAQPLARRLQKKFSLASMSAMRTAVSSVEST